MIRYAVDSEWRPLRAVLLCKPHPRIESASNPKKVLHVAKIDYAIIKKEFEQVVETYKKFKVKVLIMDPFEAKGGDNRHLFNLMFSRDAFFMTPRGAVMAKMFSEVRRNEVKYVQDAIAASGIHVRTTIRGKATFEGADALWINKKRIMVGVGNRTNIEGFCQIKEELSQDGIECFPVPAPRRALHLLGALQFISEDMALIKGNSVDPEILKLLKKSKIKTVIIPENVEIRNKHAMNFVTLAPRVIIMPAGCRKTKRIYEQLNIKVAAEVPITQFWNGGGGLACATGVLARG